MSRALRRTLRMSAVVALVLALAAIAWFAAGTWLAPGYVRDVLVRQAADAGLALRIGEIETDPWRLVVTARDIALFPAEATGKGVEGAGVEPLATARLASVDLLAASALPALARNEAWVIEQARLEAPDFRVTIGRDGQVNWALAGGNESGQPEAAPEDDKPASAVLVENLAVTGGAVHLVDRSRGEPATLELQDLALMLQGLGSRNGASPYKLSAILASGGRLESEGTVSLQPVAASGIARLSGADLPKLLSVAMPDLDDLAQGQLSVSSRFEYPARHEQESKEDRSGLVLLNDVNVEARNVAYALNGHPIELSHVAIDAPSITVPPLRPVEVKLVASVAGGGEVLAAGTLEPRALSGEAKVEVSRLPLPLAQPWLSELAAVRLVSGTVSANGKAQFAAKDAVSGSFDGRVSVRGLRVEAAEGDQVLLAWQGLATERLQVRFSPLAIEAGEIVAQGPEARLVVLPDGRTNFAALLAARDEAPGDAGDVRANVERLRIEEGTLHFTDRSLENPFDVTVRELQGSVTGLSTASPDPARVRLEGRVQKYGTARIRGTVELDAPAERTTLIATLRNLDLREFTPYFVKFAGYRIAEGRLNADLRYRVREGRLVGENQLLIERLELGEKVERAGAADLPLELAVALLTDAKGRIDIGVPVRGDLRDPQFDFGAILAKAMGNVVKKIVTAPFRALASLGDKNERDLASVAFEPGAATLPPPEEEDVDRIATALRERPRLGVAVQGRYDPEADLAALRERTVRSAIAKAAGLSKEGAAEPGALDLRDPKVVDAAERVFLDRGGNRYALSQLRSGKRAYGRAIFERLVQDTSVDESRAEALGKARAQAIQEALAARGVDPSRVRIQEPERVSRRDAADKAGVPTQLSLERARATAS